MLKQEIKNIEILYDKALYNECNKTLHRAKRIAREEQALLLLVRAVELGEDVAGRGLREREFTKDLDALIDEEREGDRETSGTWLPTTSCIQRSTACSAVVATCAPMRSMPWSRRSASTPLSRARTRPKADGRLLRFYTQGFCQWAKRDWVQSFEKFSRAKQILDDNPLIKADLPEALHPHAPLPDPMPDRAGPFQGSAG